MKKSTQALAISSLLLTCSASFAGGVEMPEPLMWDFYIGGSGAAYGLEHRVNTFNLYDSVITSNNISYSGPAIQQTQYKDIEPLGGFDVGLGVWDNRAYYGIEGRYDIGVLRAGNAFTMESGLTARILQYFTIDSSFKNNAFLVAKLGLRCRMMLPYIMLGWAHTNLNYHLRQFSYNNLGNTNELRTVVMGHNTVKRSLNGGTIGFGMMHFLGHGLSAFGEFALTGFSLPYKYTTEFLYLNTNAPIVDGVQPDFAFSKRAFWRSNLFYYNLRVGLNWSFAALM